MIDKATTSKYLRAMRPQVIFPWTALLLTVILILRVSPAVAAGQVEEANAGRGGESVDVRPLLAPGRMTLIDFYSPYCPPCLMVAPLLEQLAQKRPDLVIRKLNINRPGFKGIDWRSPLAQQYRIRAVPHFVIFNQRGKMLAEGKAAAPMVERWLKEAGLIPK
jgi:thiol-disulfide isomerase/thioredoxin